MFSSFTIKFINEQKDNVSLNLMITKHEKVQSINSLHRWICAATIMTYQGDYSK